jgi:hypothetical protein
VDLFALTLHVDLPMHALDTIDTDLEALQVPTVKAPQEPDGVP